MTLRYTTHSMPGGIHPPERKSLSNGVAIRSAPLPTQLVIPLGQHIGAEASPVVTIGERVYRGQVIGVAEGKISAPVHASSSGRVSAIAARPVQHPSGLPATCIVIDTDREDRWLPTLAQPVEKPVPCLTSLDGAQNETFLNALSAAGIVGLGGAGFPTALKAAVTQQGASALSTTTQKQGIHTLILNAVECEPYITADDLTLRQRSRGVLMGCDWLCTLSGAQNVLIGIEDNKPEAITALQLAIQEYDIEKNTRTAFEIVVVPTKYPSGGEKQLIQLITGQEVPQGGLPASLGLLCQNVGTAYAVYEALSLNRPLTARITTLTGEALPAHTRGNYEVRLGTPVASLLNALDVNWAQVDRLVMGGPMMGFTLESADIPIVKVTNCLIAAPFSELPPPAPEMPCIRCGHCAEVCPASLLPQQLYWYSKSQDRGALSQYNVLDCIECGACSYVCPSQIPLVQYFRFGKGMIRQHVAETQKSDHARTRFEARQARLEREQAEREAKRKARAKKTAPPSTPPRTTTPGTTTPGTTAPHHNAPANTASLSATEAASPSGSPAAQAQTPAAAPAPTNKANNTTIERTPVAQQPRPKSADTLKTEYLKAEKRYKDLNRALTHLEKQAKNSPSAEKTEQLNNHKEKVTGLKNQVDDLKTQWLAARKAEAEAPSIQASSAQAPSAPAQPTHAHSKQGQPAATKTAQQTPETTPHGPNVKPDTQPPRQSQKVQDQPNADNEEKP